MTNQAENEGSLNHDDTPHTSPAGVDDSPESDPEIDSAIRHGWATFNQWASAWLYSRTAHNDSPSSRAKWIRYRDG